MVSGRTAAGLLITVFCALSPAFAGDTDVTRRSRNDAREGPGSYYPLVCVLPADTPVEILSRQGGWFQVLLESPGLIAEQKTVQPGPGFWLSRNCFREKGASSPPRELSFPWQSLSASPAAVSAAVRGFAQRFSPAREGCLDELEKFGQGLLPPEEVLRFREESARLLKEKGFARAPSTTDPALLTPCEISLAEEGVGQGIAARIADRGLLENRELQVYGNLLSVWMQECTGAYDVPFTVYVLQGDDLYAMAVPGGKIFLTEGMVRACRDEAELAAVIAHEMMHVILRHGVREMGERPMKIKADLAINELDKEAGEPNDPVMEGLERYAAAAYESVARPRLQSYEVEADRGAMLLLACAGYDPSSLPRMVTTIRDRTAAAGPAARDNPFLKMDFEDRARKASSFVEGSLKGVRGVTNRERFLRNTTVSPPGKTPPGRAPDVTRHPKD